VVNWREIRLEMARPYDLEVPGANKETDFDY